MDTARITEILTDSVTLDLVEKGNRSRRSPTPR